MNEKIDTERLIKTFICKEKEPMSYRQRMSVRMRAAWFAAKEAEKGGEIVESLAPYMKKAAEVLKEDRKYCEVFLKEKPSQEVS